MQATLNGLLNHRSASFFMTYFTRDLHARDLLLHEKKVTQSAARSTVSTRKSAPGPEKNDKSVRLDSNNEQFSLEMLRTIYFETITDFWKKIYGPCCCMKGKKVLPSRSLMAPLETC